MFWWMLKCVICMYNTSYTANKVPTTHHTAIENKKDLIFYALNSPYRKILHENVLQINHVINEISLILQCGSVVTFLILHF